MSELVLKKRGYDINENCFDLLRLIAAVMVVLSHSLPRFGWEKPPFLLFFTSGSTGVMMFNAISGYLIMASYERCRELKNGLLIFYTKRFFRIIPAYLLSFLVMVVLDSLVFGIDIFSREFILYELKYIFAVTGKRFGTLGLSNVVLWTLRSEITFYILTPIIYKLTHKLNLAGWLITIGSLSLLNFFDNNIYDFVISRNIPFLSAHADTYVYIFYMYELLIGSFIYLYKDGYLITVLSDKKTVIIYLALFCVYFNLYNFTDLIPALGKVHYPFFGLCVPPLTLGIGYAFGRIRLKYDLSYSIYLFHMPILGVAEYIGAAEGVRAFVIMLAVVLCTSVTAMMLVERPFMRLSGRITGKLRDRAEKMTGV